MTSSDLDEPSAQLLIARNAAKEAVSDENLTPPQHQAVQELLDAMAQDGLYNLVGPSGSGKTFLAWHLTAKHDDWSYYAWLPVIEDVDASVAIVDNAPATRTASRRAREIRTFTDADTVIVLSKNAIPEATAYVHLSNVEQA